MRLRAAPRTSTACSSEVPKMVTARLDVTLGEIQGLAYSPKPEVNGRAVNNGHMERHHVFQEHRAHCRRPSPRRTGGAASQYSCTHLVPSSGCTTHRHSTGAELRPRLDRRGGTRNATPNGVLRIHPALGVERERSRPHTRVACATCGTRSPLGAGKCSPSSSWSHLRNEPSRGASGRACWQHHSRCEALGGQSRRPRSGHRIRALHPEVEGLLLGGSSLGVWPGLNHNLAGLLRDHETGLGIAPHAVGDGESIELPDHPTSLLIVDDRACDPQRG